MKDNDLENFARQEGNHEFADRLASRNPFTGNVPKKDVVDSVFAYHEGVSIQKMLDEIDDPDVFVEDPDQYINGFAVAELFGWSASSTVRKNLYKGFFDGVRMKVRSGRYYYHREDIEALVDQQEGTGADLRLRRLGGAK